MLIRSLLLSATVLTFPAAAYGQEPQQAPQQQAQPQQAPQTTNDPATFTTMAAVGDLFEIQSSQLALERSQNGDVQAFAQQMIEDHGAASQSLTQAAAEEGWEAPSELDERHQAMLESLASQEGQAFDSAYIDAQVQAHDQAVALFEGYAANGPDGALKNHAVQSLPTLQQHQQHVHGLADTIRQAQAQESGQQGQDGQQTEQPQQAAMAEQCMNSLSQFSQRLNEEQFWVTGWGNRWGTGVEGAVAVDGLGSPWSSVEGDLRSPRAQIRHLYGAAQVLAYRGDEEGCEYLTAILGQTYEDYTARLSEAGVEPAAITDWRQEQLALAQPVYEHEQLQQLNVDDITGTDVRTPQDEHLGSVSDIVIDSRSGEVNYAVVARGGFLGFGEDYVAVPWNQFRATPGLNTLVLDVSPETLDQAPAIDPDTFGNPANYAQHNEQIGQFWNAD